jgi:hypothetical protein
MGCSATATEIPIRDGCSGVEILVARRPGSAPGGTAPLGIDQRGDEACGTCFHTSGKPQGYTPTLRSETRVTIPSGMNTSRSPEGPD